jgi:hypothetical protein
MQDQSYTVQCISTSESVVRKLNTPNLFSTSWDRFKQLFQQYSGACIGDTLRDELRKLLISDTCSNSVSTSRSTRSVDSIQVHTVAEMNSIFL